MRGVEHQLVDQVAVRREVLVRHRADERLHRVAVAASGSVRLDLVEQRVGDGQREVPGDLRVGDAEAEALGEPDGRRLVALRSGVRGAGEHLGATLVAHVPHHRLDQRGARPASAMGRVDHREHPALVGVVQQTEVDDPGSHQRVAVVHAVTQHQPVAVRLAEGGRQLVVGPVPVPRATVLHLRAPRHVVERAHLLVVERIEGAGPHGQEPRRPAPLPSPALLPAW